MAENQVSSPVKEIPDCWQDDKRMNVLFSPFRKRELNPIDYDSKMKFWNNVIVQWCLENNNCILTLTALKSAFKRKGRTPSCLTRVLEELLRSGDLKSKTEFLDTNSSDSSWTGWAVNSVKAPFIWSFSKLKEALQEIDINELPYICLGYLKKKSVIILLSVKQNPEKSLYTIDEMRKLIEPPECTIEIAELLLHWLKLENKACSVVCDNHILIKFIISSGPQQITDREIAQFKLGKSKEILTQTIFVLEKEKEKALNEAKEFLSKGMRMAAKSSLRKKKALEECITKRVSTMDNIDLIISRIRDVQSDAEVYDSYKMGLSALKVAFKEVGLTEDNVMDTINEMEEIKEMHDEIQNALGHQMQPNTEQELEEELSSILSATKLDDITLPELPSLNIEDLKDNENKKVKPIKFASFDF